MKKLLTLLTLISLNTSFDYADPDCTVMTQKDGHNYQTRKTQKCIAFCTSTKVHDDTTWSCPNENSLSKNSCLRFKKWDSQENKTDFDVLCFPDPSMAEWNEDALKLLLYGYTKWCGTNRVCFEDGDWVSLNCEGVDCSESESEEELLERIVL